MSGRAFVKLIISIRLLTVQTNPESGTYCVSLAGKRKGAEYVCNWIQKTLPVSS